MHAEEVKAAMKQLLEMWRDATDEERLAIRRLVAESKTQPPDQSQGTEQHRS